MPHKRRSPEQIKKDLQENFKELKQQISKKYPDIIYTHVSSNIIKNLTDKSDRQFDKEEPKGLYFSNEYRYFKEIAINSARTIYKYLYGIKIKDNILTSIYKPNKNKILNIRNKKETQAFVDKYIIQNSEKFDYIYNDKKYYKIDIDFKSVANNYAGILFTRENSDNGIHVLIYKGLLFTLSFFSIKNYGCIWRTSIINKFILLAKYNIKSKKYIATF